jgi:hypothetical protein
METIATLTLFAIATLTPFAVIASDRGGAQGMKNENQTFKLWAQNRAHPN